jgi:hypothetical protein
MARSIADGAPLLALGVVYTGGGDGPLDRAELRPRGRAPSGRMIRTLRVVVVVALLGLALSIAFMVHPP